MTSPAPNRVRSRSVVAIAHLEMSWPAQIAPTLIHPTGRPAQHRVHRGSRLAEPSTERRGISQQRRAGLGEPETEPLVLPLRFDPVAPVDTTQAQPAMKELLLKILTVLVYPLFQPFKIRSVSASASSATQMQLARWRLLGRLDTAPDSVPSVEMEV